MLKRSFTLPKSNIDPGKSGRPDIIETSNAKDTERSIPPDVVGNDDGVLPVKDFSCQQCPFTTSSQAELKKHEIKWHPFVKLVNLPSNAVATVPRSTVAAKTSGQKQKRPKPSAKLSYDCEYCEFSSDSARSFAIHESKHGRPDKHGCSLCNFACSSNRGIQNHLKYCHKSNSIKPKGKPDTNIAGVSYFLFFFKFSTKIILPLNILFPSFFPEEDQERTAQL